MKSITKEFLIKYGACEEGLEWFVENCEGLHLHEQLIKIARKKLIWASWVIPCLLSKTDRIKYAVFAAKLALPRHEKKFPESKIPRETIEAVENSDDSEKETNLRKIIDYGIELLKQEETKCKKI